MRGAGCEGVEATRGGRGAITRCKVELVTTAWRSMSRFALSRYRASEAEGVSDDR